MLTSIQSVPLKLFGGNAQRTMLHIGLCKASRLAKQEVVTKLRETAQNATPCAAAT